MQLQNIVFPVDFSDRSRAAAPFVQSMARRYGAVITLLHAIPPLPPVYFDLGVVFTEAFDAAPAASTLEARLREFAAAEFPHMETRCTVLSGEPARIIVDFAGQSKADLIALPTHGYGLFRRALLGSVTAKVLHDSTVPVWTSAHTCEPAHRAHPQPRMIVAAIDLKEETDRTLQTALALARDAGAALEILHLVPEGQASPVVRRRQVARAVASAAVADAVEVEQRRPGNEEFASGGESVEALVRRIALQKRADLVVIGRGGVHGHMLDRLHSHAYAVIRESPCPVLSV